MTARSGKVAPSCVPSHAGLVSEDWRGGWREIMGSAEDPTTGQNSKVGLEGEERTPLTDTAQLNPGFIIAERYRIVRMLGAGGMGTVYEAEHDFTGGLVAIKILNSPDADQNRRLILEARALAQINSRFVVRVLDGGVTSTGICWFSMERFNGAVLRNVIHHEGPLPLDRALYYAYQIAQGVLAAHRMDVVHRDLKPENIFIIEPEDEVRILDFGMAKSLGASAAGPNTEPMKVLGTPAYVAPERLTMSRNDHRGDVYAQGMMLREMLTGHHPFSVGFGPLDLPSPYEVGYKHLFETIPEVHLERPEIPKHVSDLICRMLAKNVEARMPMTEVVEQLEACIEYQECQKAGIPVSQRVLDVLERASHVQENENLVEGAASSSACSPSRRPQPSQPPVAAPPRSPAAAPAKFQRDPAMQATERIADVVTQLRAVHGAANHEELASLGTKPNAATVTEPLPAVSGKLREVPQAQVEKPHYPPGCFGPSADQVSAPPPKLQATVPLAQKTSQGPVQREASSPAVAPGVSKVPSPTTPVPTRPATPNRSGWSVDPVTASTGVGRYAFLGALILIGGPPSKARVCAAIWNLSLNPDGAVVRLVREATIGAFFADSATMDALRQRVVQLAEARGASTPAGPELANLASEGMQSFFSVVVPGKEPPPWLAFAQGLFCIIPAKHIQSGTQEIFNSLFSCTPDQLRAVELALGTLAAAPMECRPSILECFKLIGQADPACREAVRMALMDWVTQLTTGKAPEGPATQEEAEPTGAPVQSPTKEGAVGDKKAARVVAVSASAAKGRPLKVRRTVGWLARAPEAHRFRAALMFLLGALLAGMALVLLMPLLIPVPVSANVSDGVAAVPIKTPLAVSVSPALSSVEAVRSAAGPAGSAEHDATVTVAPVDSVGSAGKAGSPASSASGGPAASARKPPRTVRRTPPPNTPASANDDDGAVGVW